MQVNILHDGALTVELESDGTVTSKIAGKVPTLDDIARHRAVNRYLASASDSLFSEHYSQDIETEEL